MSSKEEQQYVIEEEKAIMEEESRAAIEEAAKAIKPTIEDQVSYCMQCSNLIPAVGCYVCANTSKTFNIKEERNETNCVTSNRDRIMLYGAPVTLLDILVDVGKPVALESLPKNLIGGLGVLMKYKLVKMYMFDVKSKYPDNVESLCTSRHKFVGVVTC